MDNRSLNKLGLLHSSSGGALGDFTWFENDMETGVRKLVIETDSLTAYKGLASLTQGDNQHGVMFKEFKDLLHREWIVQPRYVYRECNKAVDFLARLSTMINYGELQKWYEPSVGTGNILQ